MQARRFTGRVAIVTGGAKGIGAASARQLAAEGAAVVIGDVDDEAGAARAAELAGQGFRARFTRCDVARTEEAESLVRAAVDSFGGVDVLVNNAGVALARGAAETSEAEWDRVLDTNLKGAWLCARHAIPEIARRGGGAIVNVASNAGLVGFANLAAYCASKGGLVLLTKAMALDCALQRIRVNAVCPGHTRTPMGEGFVAAQPDPAAFVAEFINRHHPLGRMAEPDEIARAILFLASDEASFITGAALAADGGYTAR